MPTTDPQATTTPGGDQLAHAIDQARELFARFLDGLDDTHAVAQAPGLPNHPCWTLGHLALTARRAADRVRGHDDPRPLPEADFADGPAGDADRFAAEAVSYCSTPRADAGAYPTLPRARAIFDAAHDDLAAALRAAPPEALARPTPWGAGTTTPGELAIRMVFHLGTHAGQLIDLRRALGLPPALAAPKR